jgi:peptidyl-tRNA hydrolase
MGIAPTHPVEIPLEKYVLNPFEKSEEKKLKTLLDRATDSCRLWLTSSIQQAMNLTNQSES